MHPFWFFIGPIPIRAYSTIFVAAFLLGLVVALYVMKAEGLGEYTQQVMDLAFWWFIGGIIGARFWQVFFFDWPYYRANPGEILAIWHGGLSIQGGLAGAVVVTILYMRKHPLPLWALADCVAPGIILGQSIGRDANLMNGDAFGSPNPAGYGLLYPPESLAQQTYPGKVLWPAEVWEGQLDVIIFALLILVLLWRGKRLVRGSVFLLYLILYNAARIFLEMLRGDSPRYLGWTAAQWTSAATIVVCAGIWGFLWWQQRRGGTPPAAADGPEAPAAEEPAAAEGQSE